MSVVVRFSFVAVGDSGLGVGLNRWWDGFGVFAVGSVDLEGAVSAVRFAHFSPFSLARKTLWYQVAGCRFVGCVRLPGAML